MSGQSLPFLFHFQVQGTQFVLLCFIDLLTIRGLQFGVYHGQFQQVCLFLDIIFQVTLLFPLFYLEQRRLCDKDMTALQQLRHLTIKKRQQQGADMRAVHVRIGHDDHPVVAQFADVKFILADSTAQGRDQGAHFRGRKHLVKTRFLHVQYLSLQR